MSESSELALIARCQRGDPEAFRELVERYQTMVYGLAVRLTRDRSEAEDLTQEVFLRIHRGLPYFRGEARLGTWIYRIVMNLCARHRTTPEARVPVDRHGATGAEPATTEDLVGSLVGRDLIAKAMARLPPQYQVVVAAHYLDGIQYDALAEALDVPVGTIKTHLHRARRQMRDIIEDLLGSAKEGPR